MTRTVVVCRYISTHIANCFYRHSFCGQLFEIIFDSTSKSLEPTGLCEYTSGHTIVYLSLDVHVAGMTSY